MCSRKCGLRVLGRRSSEANEGFAAIFESVCKWPDDSSSESNKDGLRYEFRHEIWGAERLVHQIRPTQRTFTTSTTFPPPVNPPALQRGRIWVTRIVVLKKISERRRHRNLPADSTAPRHCLINPSCSQTSPRIRPI